jgi:hypothetical protein
LQPAEAAWVTAGQRLACSSAYEVVRTAADPRAALLAFLASVYQAGAGVSGWDTVDLASSWWPNPLEED